jgi:glycerol-3-phosphate dehydrogenase (NAD(P)+)
VASEHRPVTVVGDGSMGATLAHLVASGGRACTLWCRDEETARTVSHLHRHPVRPDIALSPALAATASLDEAARDAGLIIVAVSSTSFRETACQLAPFLEPTQPLLSATKGIELATLRCMSAVLQEIMPAAAVGAIAGPNITPELIRKQPTTIVVASPSAVVRELAERALATPRLHVSASADLHSIELASVLKNVVAIAVGVAIGRELGFNAAGIVFAEGLAEIEALGVALGADALAFRGIAGIGDLFLTASSPHSLNRRAGIELGRGRPLAEVLEALPEVPEGIGAVRACRALARKMGLSLPIAETTADILDGRTQADAMERLLSERRAGDET